MTAAFTVLVLMGLRDSAPRVVPPSTEREGVLVSVTTGARGAETCRSARKGLAFYTKRRAGWLARMGAGQLGAASNNHPPLSCPQLRLRAQHARWRSWVARYRYQRWLESWRVRMQDPEQAIRYVFGRYANEAIRVAACESGDRDGDLSLSVVRAHNGQYLGMFQMGSWERQRFGHGRTPLAQTRAAYRYFVLSGRDWSPWGCQP